MNIRDLLKSIGQAWLTVLIIGLLSLWSVGFTDQISGWLWGMGTMAIYFLMLAYHSHTIQGVDTRDVISKVRFQMMQRLLMIVVSLVIALAYVHPAIPSLVIALAIMHPILYVIQWRLK